MRKGVRPICKMGSSAATHKALDGYAIAKEDWSERRTASKKEDAPDLSTVLTEEDVPDPSTVLTEEDVPDLSTVLTEEEVRDLSTISMVDQTDLCTGISVPCDQANAETVNGMIPVISVLCDQPDAESVAVDAYAATPDLPPSPDCCPWASCRPPPPPLPPPPPPPSLAPTLELNASPPPPLSPPPRLEASVNSSGLSALRNLTNATAATAAERTDVLKKCQRRVQISDSVIVHEIQPYSEVYGLHPREFVFGRYSHMIPAPRVVAIAATSPKAEKKGDDAESDGDNEFEELRGRAVNEFLKRQVSLS